MQRSTGGFYQPLTNRSKEYLTLVQTQNITPAASLPQQHWKKKVLNKSGTSKRRQNPARQAAVRSFKKYQFSNQDFLLRKYFRSVKKELQPKQNEVPTESVSGITNLVGNCTISRPPVDNSSSKRVLDVSNLRSKISEKINSNASLINNKKILNGLEMEASINDKTAEFDIDLEVKNCPKRNWPTIGFERPTFENVEILSQSFTLCDDELKEILNDSENMIALYCKSIRDLTDILHCYDCDTLLENNLNGCAEHCLNEGETKNKTGDRFYQDSIYDNESVVKINDHYDTDDNVLYNDNNVKINYRPITKNKYPIPAKKTDYKNYSDTSDNSDDIEGNEDEGGNKSSHSDYDDSANEVDGGDDEDEDEDEDENDNDDEDSDDDEVDGNVDHNNEVDGQKDSSSDEGNESDNIQIGEKKLFGSETFKFDKTQKNSNEKNNTVQDVISIDTTDSSSVSSSQENTSVSTETCSDNQVSDIHETCGSKNKDNPENVKSVSSDNKFETGSPLTNVRKSQQFITIRNREYPVSLLDNNPTLVEYLKENQSNLMTKNIVINNQNCHSIGINHKSQRYIKIRNREYPVSILENNPTLLQYVTETQPSTLPEGIVNHDSDMQPSLANNSRSNGTVKGSEPKEKIQSSEKLFNVLNHSKFNLKTNKEFKQITDSAITHDSHNVQSQNKQGKRITNEEKNKESKGSDVLSSVCSVEDGLAFLDNQNVVSQPINICHPTTSLQLGNETITLYNHSTSCTLPFPNPKSQNITKSSCHRNGMDLQNTRVSCSPNSVACQVNFSKARDSPSSLSFDGSQFRCMKCKTADANLRESVRKTCNYLNDLVTTSIVLKSLFTEENITDKTTKFFLNLNNTQ